MQQPSDLLTRMGIKQVKQVPKKKEFFMSSPISSRHTLASVVQLQTIYELKTHDFHLGIMYWHVQGICKDPRQRA